MQSDDELTQNSIAKEAAAAALKTITQIKRELFGPIAKTPKRDWSRHIRKLREKA